MSDKFATAGFVYIWIYEVNPHHLDDYLAYYHDQGHWAKFFGDSPAYIGTRLMRDAENALRFTTMDFWTDKAQRDAYKSEHQQAFDAIDARCETFTRSETLVGEFVLP